MTCSRKTLQAGIDVAAFPFVASFAGFPEAGCLGCLGCLGLFACHVGEQPARVWRSCSCRLDIPWTWTFWFDEGPDQTSRAESIADRVACLKLEIKP